MAKATFDIAIDCQKIESIKKVIESIHYLKLEDVAKLEKVITEAMIIRNRVKEDSNEVRAMYETGHKKAIDLSKEYDIPRNTLSRWIKEELWNISEQTDKAISKHIEVMEHFTEQTEQTQKAMTKIVKEKTSHLDFINNATKKNLKSMMKKVKKETTIFEHKAVQETIDKGAITLGVAQRHANTTINNNNAQQNNTQQDIQGYSVKTIEHVED
jgi:hypothetical protein